MVLVFSASMAFKYALASEPKYMRGYLTNINATSDSIQATSDFPSLLGTENSFPAQLRDKTLSFMEQGPMHWWNVMWGPNASIRATSEFKAMKTFWGVFLGLVFTMGALLLGIWSFSSAVMFQVRALQPRTILAAGEGQIQRSQLWELVEKVKTVYASKDCIPTGCLNVLVRMLLLVGFVEGGVVLAWVAQQNGDVQKSFGQSPELFVATLGTVVPLAFIVKQAADPLVACNEKLEKCKSELKNIKRDFQKCMSLSKTEDQDGIERAVKCVEQELDDLRPATLFGLLPYSRGSKLVILLVFPACQLGGAVVQALKFFHEGDP